MKHGLRTYARFPALAASILVLVLSTAAAAAEDVTTEVAVERLFEAPEMDAAWFTPAFLAEIPLTEVERLVAELTQEFGQLREVSGSGTQLMVRLERAHVPTRIVLDGDGRIAGLRLDAPIVGSLEDHVAVIAALPGRTSVLVASGGVERAAHAADTVLAVGSAAKLAVIQALEKAIAAGHLAWDQVVPLDPQWRSLPSGILQDCASCSR